MDTCSPSNFVPKEAPAWWVVYRSSVRGVAASIQSILARTPGMNFSRAVIASSISRAFFGA